MTIRLKLPHILRNRLKIKNVKRAVYWVLASIVLTAFLALSLYLFFFTYLSTPRLHLSMEKWEEVEQVSLGIMLSDESRKRFEGFADTVDVSIHLLSPNYGIITISIPISNATTLAGRDFALESRNIDWSYSTVSLKAFEATLSLQVNASDPDKATFQLPTDIQTGYSFYLWAQLRPLNVSKNMVHLSFFMRLNASQFNITESLFTPPEFQLSHAPFYQPRGTVHMSELGATVERLSSETYSMYLLRRSDMYIEKVHFEQNISLILSVFLFTSFVSLLAVFLELDKRFFKT